jgi:hypothetical protein
LLRARRQPWRSRVRKSDACSTIICSSQLQLLTCRPRSPKYARLAQKLGTCVCRLIQADARNRTHRSLTAQPMHLRRASYQRAGSALRPVRGRADPGM